MASALSAPLSSLEGVGVGLRHGPGCVRWLRASCLRSRGAAAFRARMIVRSSSETGSEKPTARATRRRPPPPPGLDPNLEVIISPQARAMGNIWGSTVGTGGPGLSR